jgi:hypothetical protein
MMTVLLALVEVVVVVVVLIASGKPVGALDGDCVITVNVGALMDSAEGIPQTIFGNAAVKSLMNASDDDDDDVDSDLSRASTCWITHGSIQT